MKKEVLKMAAIVLLSVAGSGLALAEPVHGAPDRYAVARLKTVKGNYLAFLRAEALQGKNTEAAGKVQDPGPASAWMTRVNASEVNMVTNRYEKKKQGEVNLNGKSYYCSGEAFMTSLEKNPSLRYAQDPLTNRKVDKSGAEIYADASGRAYYFESEDTYKEFINLGDMENKRSASLR